MPSLRAIWLGGLIVLACLAGWVASKERVQRFDKDPGWEGRNNRSSTPAKRTVHQDFGYSRTTHAGGKIGEIGGLITSAAEPAWYARKIDAKSFADPLTASGRLVCKGRQFHVLVGFFNSKTVNEWRTPNAISLRLQGKGDVFYAYVEYATSRWGAGGDTPGGFATVRDKDTGKLALKGFKAGAALDWSLRYDPKGNKGGGAVTVTLGGETAVCHLDKGHKADGATFDRFGIMPVLKSAHGGGEVWLDDVTINGTKDDFSRDPGWEGVGNRRRYESADVRPRFDFGYNPTRYARGKASGELGGLVFRGDCRYRERLACYGDRLATLGLDKPLKASGKVALRRGVSDSTVLLGFYHSKDSMEVNPSQSSGWPKGFLGVVIEGPSREGFFFYPAYRLRGGEQAYASGDGRPRILPDGKSHDWSLEYAPDGRGRIAVALDGKAVKLELGEGHRKAGVRFDRVGIVTTWIDGNGQRVYFDDLVYTCEQ